MTEKKTFSPKTPTIELEGTCIFSKEEDGNLTLGILIPKSDIKPSLFRNYADKDLPVIRAGFQPSTNPEQKDSVVLFASNRPDYLYKKSEVTAAVGANVVVNVSIKVTEKTEQYPNPRAFFNLKNIETLGAEAVIEGDEDLKGFFSS